MIKKLCIIASAIFVLAVAGVLGWMHIMGDNKEFAKEGAQIVHVKVGMTTADIADMLHEKQLVKNPKAFKFEARFKGLANKLQAGMYKIEGGMSNGAIVNEFANGRIELIDFIVPEGFNVVKTGRKLESLGLGSAEKFIELAKNYAPYDYMKTDNPHVIFKTEGFLYPATYKVPYGASEEEYLRILVRHFNEVMEKKTRFYVSRKNVLTWLMALCMVCSAVARILVGVKGTEPWSQIVLPIAAALL
ncbi:MAG: endolytic transglycosylase MltG, partial [Phascolarctobacterium sp.]|nr:endolytic transglycosylase MltG [Phascolarctobacterium sp.]